MRPLPLLQRAHDKRAEDEVIFLISTPPNSGALLLQQLDEGMAKHDLPWYSIRHREEAVPSTTQASPRESWGITPEDTLPIEDRWPGG